MSRHRRAAHVGDGGNGSRSRRPATRRRTAGPRAGALRLQASGLRRGDVLGGERPRRALEVQAGGANGAAGDPGGDDLELPWGAEPTATGPTHDARRTTRESRGSPGIWSTRGPLRAAITGWPKRWKRSGVLLRRRSQGCAGVHSSGGRALHRAGEPAAPCRWGGGAREESRAAASRNQFETVKFRAQLARALAGEGDPPRLEFTAHD